jgi:hypothetical protein
MKKNKRQRNFQLSAYAAAALCFLIKHQEANAQVVYTDVDPDIVLDAALETAGLDIDNNGTIDFAFQNSSFTYFNGSWLSYRLTQDILIGPYNSINNIAGNSVHFSTGYGGFTLTFPYAINSSVLIDENYQWHNSSLQILALKRFYENGEIFNYYNQCYWFNFHINETLYQNLAIKFRGEDDQFHFGWIRCSVIDSGRTLIIHDYAYELQPDYPILAGDTISYVNIYEQENTLEASVYSFDKNVFVHINEYSNILLIISDLSGKEILKKKLMNDYSTIDMNVFPTGIYLVTLRQDDKLYHKKIHIN